MTVFLSGSVELEENTKKSIDEIRKEKLFPQIDYINAQELPFNSPCSRHTEPLFWEMLSRKPETILHIANQVLNPKEDKIEHVFYDFYSFHDVCLNCQYMFKEKQFQNETLINVIKKLAEHFKTDEFLLSSFRVNSYSPYDVGYDSNGTKIRYDIPYNLTNAYGGSNPEKKGINTKISSQLQILLNARTTYGPNSYSNHKQNLRTLN